MFAIPDALNVTTMGAATPSILFGRIVFLMEYFLPTIIAVNVQKIVMVSWYVAEEKPA